MGRRSHGLSWRPGPRRVRPGHLVGADAAHAAEPGTVVLAAESIDQVVNNIRTWLVGILVGVATLFLTVGGLRYLAANGDPGEVEKAKTALRSAALGYAWRCSRRCS